MFSTSINNIPSFLNENQKETLIKIYNQAKSFNSIEYIIAPTPGHQTLWIVLNNNISSDIIDFVSELASNDCFLIEVISEQEAEEVKGYRYAVHA